MKDFNPDDLVERMREDADSEWPSRLMRDLSDAPLVDEKWLSKINTPRDVSSQHRLSEQEVRVLLAMSHGLTAEMAAKVFHVSPTTLKDTTKTIRFKLRAKNTTHAVARALRMGIIE